MSRQGALGTLALIALGGVLIVAGIWVGVIGFGSSYEMMQGPDGFGMYEVKQVFPGAGLALGASGIALIVYGFIYEGSSDESATKIITVNDNNNHDN